MRVWADYSLELKRDVTASKNTDLKNHKALMNGIAAKNAQKAEKTFTGTRENTQGLWMRQSWWSVGNTASVQLLEENWNTQLEFGSKKQKLYVKFDTVLPDVATIHRRRRRRKTWKDISCGIRVSEYGGERVHGQHHDWRDRGERRVDQSVEQCVPKHEQRRRTIVWLFWSVLSSHDSSKTTFYEAFKGQGIL